MENTVSRGSMALRKRRKGHLIIKGAALLHSAIRPSVATHDKVEYIPQLITFQVECESSQAWLFVKIG